MSRSDRPPGYLLGVLRDGAAPFAYRTGVRELLAAPAEGGLVPLPAAAAGSFPHPIGPRDVDAGLPPIENALAGWRQPPPEAGKAAPSAAAAGATLSGPATRAATTPAPPRRRGPDSPRGALPGREEVRPATERGAATPAAAAPRDVGQPGPRSVGDAGATAPRDVLQPGRPVGEAARRAATPRDAAQPAPRPVGEASTSGAAARDVVQLAPELVGGARAAARDVVQPGLGSVGGAGAAARDVVQPASRPVGEAGTRAAASRYLGESAPGSVGGARAAAPRDVVQPGLGSVGGAATTTAVGRGQIAGASQSGATPPEPVLVEIPGARTRAGLSGSHARADRTASERDDGLAQLPTLRRPATAAVAEPAEEPGFTPASAPPRFVALEEPAPEPLPPLSPLAPPPPRPAFWERSLGHLRPRVRR